MGHSHLKPGWYGNYYSLAYVPPASTHSGCHKITVKVDRRNAIVYARDQYCEGQSPRDLLFGSKEGKQLDRTLALNRRGTIPLSLQTVAFHSAADAAEVDVAIGFPWNVLAHSWNASSLSLHARIAVMGIVRAKDGTVAARFSDLLYPSYWPTFLQGKPAEPKFLGDGVTAGENYLMHKVLSLWTPGWLPTRYETQFELVSGDYTPRSFLSDGKNYGHAQSPLHVVRYGGRQLALGGIALCKRFRDASVATEEATAANFAPQYVPLVSKNVQFTPTGDTRFEKGQPLIAYFEVYAPILVEHPATSVRVQMRILDAETDKVREVFTAVNAASYRTSGSTVIPIARKIPFGYLPKGSYQLEVRASDSAGRSTPRRYASFTVE